MSCLAYYKPIESLKYLVSIFSIFYVLSEFLIISIFEQCIYSNRAVRMGFSSLSTNSATCLDRFQLNGPLTMESFGTTVVWHCLIKSA